MENYFYSAKDNTFFPESLKEIYMQAGTWPENAKEVGEMDFQNLMAGQSENKVITADEAGYPVLSERETDHHIDAVKQAETEKALRMAAAAEAIAPLQDAVDIGMATEDEVGRLKAWKACRVLLNRVDVSEAPDITWPEIPA